MGKTCREKLLSLSLSLGRAGDSSDGTKCNDESCPILKEIYGVFLLVVPFNSIHSTKDESSRCYTTSRHKPMTSCRVSLGINWNFSAPSFAKKLDISRLGQKGTIRHAPKKPFTLENHPIDCNGTTTQRGIYPEKTQPLYKSHEWIVIQRIAAAEQLSPN